MVSKTLKPLTILVLLLVLTACATIKQQQSSESSKVPSQSFPAYPIPTKPLQQPTSTPSKTESPLPATTQPLPKPTDTPQENVSQSTPPLITVSPPIWEVSFTYDRNHDYLLAFGGRRDQENATRNETWVWDAQTWNQLQPVGAPPTRMAAGLVCDPFHKTTILFGGVEVQYVGKELRWTTLQDTWLWDGKNWIEQHPSVFPSQRRNPQMVYDASRQEVLLFGGIRDGEDGGLPTFLDDTWIWNGQTWTEHSSGDLSNGAIPQPSMAYDAAHQKVVLWQYGTGTWLWDNTQWINLHPASSPDLYIEGILGYDEVHQQIIFWGINNKNGGAVPETWFWDGITWTSIDTGRDSGPGSVAASTKTMVYDTQHQSLLLIVVTNDNFTNKLSIWLWTSAGWKLLTVSSN